jgi:nicotinate-nucleotide adenylyltransferase
MEPSASLGNRIGILGGTFDPVHQGHLALATAARECFALDSVLFIPAASPPHKLGAPLAPFADRVAMLRLALSGTEGFVISEMERDRPGPSYSIDTLKELRQQLGEEVRLFFCIGMDAFAEITSWKNYAELFHYAGFVVVERPDSGGMALADFIAAELPHFRQGGERAWAEADGPGRIYALAMPGVPVSSTLVRERAARGESLAGLVPGEVAGYIARHGLYRPSTGGR